MLPPMVTLQVAKFAYLGAFLFLNASFRTDFLGPVYADMKL